MTDGLYCIVTKAETREENIKFAFEHLISKGYNCKCIVVRGKHYIVRRFSASELSNKVLLHTHGRNISKERGEYFFNISNLKKGISHVISTESN